MTMQMINYLLNYISTITLFLPTLTRADLVLSQSARLLTFSLSANQKALHLTT
jgi:hypothetical protein